MSVNAQYIVDHDPAQGSYTTVQAAIDAAAAAGGGDVIVHSGTYTENLTLPNIGVHLIQVSGPSGSPTSALIEGSHTLTQTGQYTFTDLKFHYGLGTIWTISGSGAGQISFNACIMISDDIPTGRCINASQSNGNGVISNCIFDAAQEVIVASNSYTFHCVSSSLSSLIGVAAPNVSLTNSARFSSRTNTYQSAGGPNISISGLAIFASDHSNFNPNGGAFNAISFAGAGSAWINRDTICAFDPHGYYAVATGVFEPTPTITVTPPVFTGPAKLVGPNIIKRST
jgi:pectin methylesterase-like acyl-CoA thioesterase